MKKYFGLAIMMLGFIVALVQPTYWTFIGKLQDPLALGALLISVAVFILLIVIIASEILYKK